MDQVNVSWSEFSSSLPKLFNSHRIEDRFTDVTLVSDDNQLFKAHKLVLSSVSRYFDKILEDKSHPHLMICLDGINSGDLTNILKYIYNGEIMLPASDLQQFLKVATKLKCLGLSIFKPEEGRGPMLTDQAKSPHGQKDEDNLFSEVNTFDPLSEANSQDKLNVKAECSSKDSETERFILSESKTEDAISSFILSTDNPSMSINPIIQIPTIPTNMTALSDYMNMVVCSMNGEGISRQDLNTMLEQFILPEPNDMFSCTQCPTPASRKNIILKHAETHLNLQWKCDKCSHLYGTSENLRKHKRLCDGQHTKKSDGRRGGRQFKIIKEKRKRIPVSQFCKINGEMFAMSDLRKKLEELYQKVGEYNYNCLKCSKITTNKNHIEEHAQIHIGDLEFKCDDCDKTFSSTAAMRQPQHMKRCQQLKQEQIQTEQQRILKSLPSVFPKKLYF